MAMSRTDCANFERLRSIEASFPLLGLDAARAATQIVLAGA
jgi:hypothetical protein